MPTDYKKLYQNHDIILTNADPEALVSDGSLESVGYLENYFKEKNRFKPPVDFSNLKNFARFGSAKKYYVDAFDRIYETYPYDGSLKERVDWELSSSYFDLYVFDQVYPRTNGHVIFSAEGWSAKNASSDHYGEPTTKEYILVKGGPRTSKRSKDKEITDTSGDYKSGYANIWQPSKNRECNLKIGGIDGNTIEFWMKKDEFVTSDTGREVIFDAHTTDFVSSSANYGRLTLELTGTTSGCPFSLTYMSGTSGFSEEGFNNNTITTSSVADGDWHHYAFTLKNVGTDAEIGFYFDGKCTDTTIVSNSSIGYISGSINATIGSLITFPSGTSTPTLGWGKLSGSLDEFRYWKTARNSAEVVRYMIEPVGGGTNTDAANTSLGVYYKFNEGIVGNATYDKTILDYSGRISNGTFVGYNSSARSVGSAMVSSSLVTSEFKDPILYSFHPSVASALETKKIEGEIHDYANNSSIYHSLPAWITEEDEDKEYSPLKNLTQVMGAYFDSLAEQINSIPKLKHKTYLSSSYKPQPFNDRLLNSIGFDYFPELFSDATELEYFKSRNDRSLFEKKLYNIKNRIYRNIYNNIIYINKSKGTEKSFRNLIHCFGLGDEIYRINTYGNRVTYTLKDNYKAISEFKKYVNFGLTGSSAATVFPYSSSANPDSKAIISASYGLTDYLGFTMESEVHFPIRHSLADSNTVATTDEGPSRQFRTYLPFSTASLFGVHQVALDATGNDLTWAANDYANFQVLALKASDYSRRCKFVLTGTGDSVIGPLNLSSSYIDDVFDDTRWSFSVSIKPNSNADRTPGSSGSIINDGYTVEFYGVEKIVDYTKNEFYATGTLAGPSGIKFLNYPKAPYIGAHRTNFSGTLRDKADGNISSTRVWFSHVPTGTIKQHHQDVKNYGVEHPFRSAYLYPNSLNGIEIPTIDTLVLNWTFDTVTGSDSSGEFVGTDYSSGSVSKTNRYGQFGELVGKQYLPKGYNFPASSALAINKKFVSSGKKQLPEMINSSDMVNILTDDDKFFNKVDLMRPTNYYTSIEKSMYQTISDEMIKMFSTIKDFNNLVGEPVNKYRYDYKDLAKLRQMFYERVGNTPDLDKYVDFYKWVDITLDTLLGYLVPASSDMSDQYGSNIRTMVENTVLHRNKYKWQYPTLEDKTPDIEGTILGINKLLYNWEYGFHPLNSLNNHCLWWKERAERTLSGSGDANVDSNRQTILNSIINETNASAPTLGSKDPSTGQISTYQGSTYATRRLAKSLRLKVDKAPVIKGGVNKHQNSQSDIFQASINKNKSNTYLRVDSSGLETPEDCSDDSGLNSKIKQVFSAFIPNDDSITDKNYSLAKGDLTAPFSLYSASLTGGYHDEIKYNFIGAVDITNIHEDSYGPLYGRPLQTPFTEKFVGGRAYRHIFSNFTPGQQEPDGIDNRIEGWKLGFQSNNLYIYGPSFNPDGTENTSLAKGSSFRDEFAKRPVNIRNIKMFTGSTEDESNIVPSRPDQVLNATNIGNYTDNYELVMTTGRSINNRYLAESDGDLPTTYIDSPYVSGAVDFVLPRRDLTGSTKSIIVNRFSAPGDPITMCEGMLDVAAAEYSIYNVLPWRNLAVREPLNELYSDHCEQFGYFSDWFTQKAWELAGETYPGGSGEVTASSYAGIGSFHKVNRNRVPQIKFSGSSTSSYIDDESFDNWFVQRQIPQTDLHYAWITASVVNGYEGPAKYGFEQPDFSNAGLASTDITFASASEIGTILVFGSRGPYVPGDALYVPTASTWWPTIHDLNMNIYEPITSSTNTIGYSAPESFITYGNHFRAWTSYMDLGKSFRMLQIKRNGLCGWPTWKQIRGSDHPVMRHNYKNNLETFEKVVTTTTSNGYVGSYKEIVSQSESPVISKFGPLKYSLQFKPSNPAATSTPMDYVTMWTSYGNEKAFFTNVPDPKISGLINLNNSPNFVYSKAGEVNMPLKKSDNKVLAYDTLKKYTLWNEPFYISGAANPIERMNSLEISETIFPREHYTYKSIVRERENFVNTFWKDSRVDRNTEVTNSQGWLTDAAGYLEATASIWSLDGPMADTDASGLWSRWDGSGSAGELQNNYALKQGWPAATYSRNILEYVYTGGANGWRQASCGPTTWEAAEQSGYNPSYNSYSEYIEEVRRVGKDYGIIPEYRISEHMQYHSVDKAAEGGFYADNPGWLTLDGASITSSADTQFYTIFTNTDFLKYFEPIEKEYSVSTMPTKLTLKCNAITKFLPYDGFYPSERSLQIATLFSQSFSPNCTLNGTEKSWRTLLTPLFSPGILYNSIKSGMAIDYPLYTSDYNAASGSFAVSSSNWAISSSATERLPFEALVDPEYFLNGIANIHDAEASWIYYKDSTGSFGSPSNDLYKYAINNFITEIPKFFLGGTDGKDGSEFGPLTTFTSRRTEEGSAPPPKAFDQDPSLEESDFIYFEQDKIYTMKIVCSHSKIRNFEEIETHPSRSANTASYVWNEPTIMLYNRAFNRSDPTEYDDIYFDYAHGWHSESVGQINWYDSGSVPLYGSSFGPPLDSYTYTAGQNGQGGFEPWTPPYYHGYSHIEVSYTPDVGGYKTISDIISDVSFSTHRELIRNYNTGSIAGDNAMQLTASVNWRQIVTKDGKTRWTIQPKWECPILDFKNSSITLPDFGSGSVAKGMWHQYGTIPAAADGVFLEIHPGAAGQHHGDLAGKLGFNSTSKKKLGQVPETGKTISEAVVAIPFYENALGKRTYFNIKKKTIDWAKAKLLSSYTTDEEYIKSQINLTDYDMVYKPAPSVVQMVKSMYKYCLPPSFNFVVREDQAPFAMVFFEFEHHFTQDDLVKMWQGILPSETRKDASSGVQHAISEIDFGMNLLSGREQLNPEHKQYKENVPFKGWDLLNHRTGDFSGISGFPTNIQWMVFKVKQRASADYYSLTADNMDMFGVPTKNYPPSYDIWSWLPFFQFWQSTIQLGAQSAEKLNNFYRYNWPYDFFSLIELVKIEETVKLTPQVDFAAPWTPNDFVNPQPGAGGQIPNDSVTSLNPDILNIASLLDIQNPENLFKMIEWTPDNPINPPGGGLGGIINKIIGTSVWSFVDVQETKAPKVGNINPGTATQQSLKTTDKLKGQGTKTKYTKATKITKKDWKI